jgi:hypothetical protein
MREIGRRHHWPEVQFPGNIPAMVVIAAATIWILFGTFLIVQLTDLPVPLYRTAMTLLAAELIALMMDDLGSPPISDIGHSAAAVDIPLLGMAVVGIAIMLAWRTRRVDEDSRHGLAREGGGGDRLGSDRRRPRGHGHGPGTPGVRAGRARRPRL